MVDDKDRRTVAVRFRGLKKRRVCERLFFARRFRGEVGVQVGGGGEGNSRRSRPI